MSHETVSRAVRDEALQDRVVAAAQKEAQNNASLKDTQKAQDLRSSPGYAVNWFMWSVAIDYETEYAYAVDNGNENPGGDAGVITDANLTSAVVAHWPPDE